MVSVFVGHFWDVLTPTNSDGRLLTKAIEASSATSHKDINLNNDGKI